MRSELTTLVALVTLAASTASQDSATPFRAPQVVVGSDYRLDLTVDLDQDGDVDYVGGFDTKVSWHRNRGDGRIESSYTLVSGISATFAKFCQTDLDNDGHDDAVCVANGTLYAILSRPGGPVVHSHASSSGMSSIFVGDLQGDGDPEVIGSTSYGFAAYTYNAQTNTFQTAISWNLSSDEMFAADFDGDGDDEIWHYDNNWMWVLDVAPNWGVTQVSSFPNALNDELLPTVGDVDGDGDTDVVLFNGLGPHVYALLRRNASGQLVAEQLAEGGPATHLSDIDGDGDLDGLFCGGGGISPYPNDFPSYFRIAINEGNGQFADSVAIDSMGSQQLGGCVDVDGDGDNDLVGGRSIIFNSGDITEVFPIRAAYARHYEPLHDADRDWDEDLGLRGGSHQFTWYESLGDGSFFPNFSVVPGGSFALKETGLTGDFDGDGDADVLMQDESGAVIQMRLYRNFGAFWGVPVDAGPPGLAMKQTSVHTPATSYTGQSHWEFAHDWDGDGDLDCVVCDQNHGTTKLFQNGGSGYFTAGPSMPAGILVLGVGDLTGDGIPDLVAGDQVNFDVLYYLPGTAGGFGAAVTLSTTIRRDERPGIADIDADGDLDILTSTSTGGALLRNDGTGQFTQEANDFASYRLCRWSFGDVDENGTLDAVSYQPYLSRGQTTTVIQQNTDGTFAPPVTLMTEASVLTDADHDGDIDLVGNNTIKNRTATGSFGVLRTFGDGTPGTMSIKPRINDIGITAPGNPMIMRVSGMRGGAAGLWVLGLGETSLSHTPLQGLTLYVDDIIAITPFIANGTPGAGGQGTWTLPWPMLSGLGGLQLSSQAFCADPAASVGWTQTNGKIMTLPN